MTRFTIGLGVALSIAIAAVIVTGCSPLANQPTKASPSSGFSSSSSNGLVQSNTEASVTIEVRWLGAKGGSLTFAVAMDTHSVDLDQYDLGKLAVLRDDAGNEYRPTSWKAAAGGHHRAGTLTFPIPDSVSQRKTSYIEITIQNIAGIKARVLKWQL